MRLPFNNNQKLLTMDKIKMTIKQKYEFSENGIKNSIETFIPPDGENDWATGAETFTRKEVFNLLWTQRAMISNDLKRNCGNELTEQILEIITYPRIPKF